MPDLHQRAVAALEDRGETPANARRIVANLAESGVLPTGIAVSGDEWAVDIGGNTVEVSPERADPEELLSWIPEGRLVHRRWWATEWEVTPDG